MSIFWIIMLALYAVGAVYWAIQFAQNFSDITHGSTTKMKVLYAVLMAAFVVTWPVTYAVLLMLLPVVLSTGVLRTSKVSLYKPS